MTKSKLPNKKRIFEDAISLSAKQFVNKYARDPRFNLMNIDDPFMPNKGFVNIEMRDIGCILYIDGRYDSFDSY